MFKLILHCLLLQVLWWSCILSAVHLNDYPWLVLLWVPILLGLQATTDWFQSIDLPIALGFTLLGFILDTLWIHFNLIEYTAVWPHENISPIWLLVLWFGVGFDFRHSLLWIADKPIIGGIIVGVSGPASYISGAALGLASFPEGAALWFNVFVFTTWAIAFPLAAKYITRYDSQGILNKDTV